MWDARSPRLVRSRIFVDGTEKKKEKNKTRVRAHTNLQISKGKSTMGSFFFFLILHLMTIKFEKRFYFYDRVAKGVILRRF